MRRWGLCVSLALICVLSACGKVEEEVVSKDTEISVSVETVSLDDTTEEASVEEVLPEVEKEPEAEVVSEVEAEEEELPLYTAPKDYIDKDIYAYYCGVPEDYLYFYPVTEDYSIHPGIIGSIYSNNEDAYFGVSHILSYNENGVCVDEKLKYVFEDEDAACRYYEFGIMGDMFPIPSTAYDTYLIGNLIYVNYTGRQDWFESVGTKSNLLVRIYKDCHYLRETYPSYSLKDGSVSYFSEYLSKPYTNAELNISLEDTVFWNNISNKKFRGTNFEDCFLEVSTDNKKLRFEIYDKPSTRGRFSDHFVGISEIRVNGRNVCGLSLGTDWKDENTGKKYMAFTELKFDDSSVKVKQYKFYVDDFSSTKFTFDNFKTKKADVVTEDTFVLE